MMLLRQGVLIIQCDETTPRDSRCVRATPLGRYGLDVAIDAARELAWRAYPSRARRDLCPDHYDKARRRMHLVRGTP